MRTIEALSIGATAVLVGACTGRIESMSGAFGDSGGADVGRPTHPGDGAWPPANVYSWDGSYAPSDADIPMEGLFDDVYYDGHLDAQNMKTPILPPGDWDWDDQPNLSGWDNFRDHIGTFELLVDPWDRPFGWRLHGAQEDAVDYSGAAQLFKGSIGEDIVNLGPKGTIASISGSLGDGPDVLVADTSHSLDFRTGEEGCLHDNDLLVLGCTPRPDGAFSITTSAFHTGPGADWVFVRDIDRAAIDLGNGDGGKTTAVDPLDGDDMVVIHGNSHDFRVFGGGGNDVFVWYVDENVQQSAWLGPSFFGGGGDDEAVWADAGIDRLVLVVPVATTLVTTTPTPDGAILVQPTRGDLIEDDPTQGDPYARYCVECAPGPGGEKSIRLEYNSADGKVRTGEFWVSSVEELQIGVGEGARVYRLDPVRGTATLDPLAVPFEPPDAPACADVGTLLRPF